MKIILTTTVLIVLVNSIVHGSIFTFEKKVHPDHLKEHFEDYPDKCRYEGPPEVLLDAGTSIIRPDACQEIECNKDLILNGYGCQVVPLTPPGCKIESDDTKLFPDCCPKVVCP